MSHIQLHDTESISRRLGFSENLDLPLEETKPTRWGIARLIRREVRRRGLVTRRELHKTIEPFFLAAGFDEDTGAIIREVADEMVELREIADLKVENQRGYAALASRWIRLSDNVAVLLGTTATEKDRFHSCHPMQFLRRFSPKADIIHDLENAGVYEQSFDDWLGRPAWLRFCKDGEQIESLEGLLSLHIDSLESEGAPFSKDSTSILAVRYQPGEFFGQPWDSGRNRWTIPSELPDGYYIGAQKGFSENQWHPLLLKISGDGCKSHFVNHNNSTADSFELRNWLLLALAARQGQRERVFVDHESSEIQVTCPLPAQVFRCIKLSGEATTGWRYRVLDSIALIEMLNRAFPMVEVSTCR